MIRPVTSTRVATKGAEDAAGSAPTLRRIKGSMDPESVPQSTTPTSAMPTVSATRGQCAPYGCRWKYCSPTIAHAPTRTMPIVPRIAPNASPARAFAHHSPQRDPHIRLVQCLHATELLDVFRCFFFSDIEHVINCHNADEHARGIHYRKRCPVVFPEYVERILLGIVHV